MPTPMPAAIMAHMASKLPTCTCMGRLRPIRRRRAIAGCAGAAGLEAHHRVRSSAWAKRTRTAWANLAGGGEQGQLVAPARMQRHAVKVAQIADHAPSATFSATACATSLDTCSSNSTRMPGQARQSAPAPPAGIRQSPRYWRTSAHGRSGLRHSCAPPASMRRAFPADRANAATGPVRRRWGARHGCAAPSSAQRGLQVGQPLAGGGGRQPAALGGAGNAAAFGGDKDFRSRQSKPMREFIMRQKTLNAWASARQARCLPHCAENDWLSGTKH